MSRCYCPICQTEYDFNPKICRCGFDGLYYPIYENQDKSEQGRQAELFRIYQYTKRVFFGEIPFVPAPLCVRECDDRLLIDGVSSNMGLIWVNQTGGDGEAQTVADAGLLAFKTNAQALILNVDLAHSDFLDESCVRVLFFGADIKGLRNGFFVPHTPIRYLYVHRDNPYFCAENNVLFNKERTRLICYAPARPEKEYCVPREVKVLGNYSFYFPRHLERLSLPRGIIIEDRALQFFEGNTPELIYY